MKRWTKRFYEDTGTMPALLPASAKERGLIEGKRKPVTELEEKNKELIATFELPGIDKKDIDINISENRLAMAA